MTITAKPSLHARNRMLERGLKLEHVEYAINAPQVTADGKNPGTKTFTRYEPPPPVVAVTTWPPDDTGRVLLITCWKIEGNGGGYSND